MIVLGVNGWTDKTHDPAAALIADGELVGFAEEERFTRTKHGVGQLPHGAAASIFQESGIHPSEVDAIACGWDRHKFDALRGVSTDTSDAIARITGIPELGHLPMTWVAHHDAHAASTFYGSGFDRATVIVADAEGEDESISIYRGDSDGLHLLRRFGRGVSLGLMYRAVSEYCGFGQFGAGQTMGLASYALSDASPLSIEWVSGELRSPFSEDAWEDDVVRGWGSILESRFGPAGVRAHRAAGGYPPLEAHKPYAAAAAQLTVNTVMTEIVREAIRLTGIPDVCLAGGVALNCVANGLLLDEVHSLHIPPYPHDAGVALGAAQWIGARAGSVWRAGARADLGSPASKGIPALADIAVVRAVNPVATAVERVLDGRVIGFMQGRMEVGPRALGRRSILALPSSVAMRDRVNHLKGREPWRPVAPSILREESATWFGRDIDAPFMLLSLPLTANGLDAMPGASHVDGSARLQTVTAKDGPLRQVLEELRFQCRVGAVLNTSFNHRGEPIVRTASEAVASARRMGLDAVIIEDLLVEIGSTE